MGGYVFICLFIFPSFLAVEKEGEGAGGHLERVLSPSRIALFSSVRQRQ